MSEDFGYTEQDLLEQWTFLDAMVDRQATQLRAGIQDDEESAAPVAIMNAGELPALRARVEELERVRDVLGTQLDVRIAEHERVVADSEAFRATAAAAISRLTDLAATPAVADTSEIAARDATIAALRSQVEALTTGLSAARAEIATLQTALAATQTPQHATVPARRWWQRY